MDIHSFVSSADFLTMLPRALKKRECSTQQHVSIPESHESFSLPAASAIQEEGRRWREDAPICLKPTLHLPFRKAETAVEVKDFVKVVSLKPERTLITYYTCPLTGSESPITESVTVMISYKHKNQFQYSLTSNTLGFNNM